MDKSANLSFSICLDGFSQTQGLWEVSGEEEITIINGEVIIITVMGSTGTIRQVMGTKIMVLEIIRVTKISLNKSSTGGISLPIDFIPTFDLYFFMCK